METYVDVEENFSRKEFKSYYVVWKQHIENKKKEADICLNRTM